ISPETSRLAFPGISLLAQEPVRSWILSLLAPKERCRSAPSRIQHGTPHIRHVRESDHSTVYCWQRLTVEVRARRLPPRCHLRDNVQRTPGQLRRKLHKQLKPARVALF